VWRRGPKSLLLLLLLLLVLLVVVVVVVVVVMVVLTNDGALKLWWLPTLCMLCSTLFRVCELNVFAADVELDADAARKVQP
jgi:hypothetical protein